MKLQIKPLTHMPHYKVFVRIAPSKINGVGVFAIREIKKGQYIFYGDNEKLVWIERNKIKHLPTKIKKLYEDFCVLKNGCYGCPNNFNLLTPAWFLNHSVKPNLGCDKNYNFYSIKKIKMGEELTVDYSTYTDTRIL